MRHLFFALSPDPALRTAMAAEAAHLHAAWGGRATTPAKLHMTLRFLQGFADPLPEDVVAAARAAGDAVANAPDSNGAFAFELDRADRFGRRVGWLGCAVTPRPLQALHDALTAACRAHGVPMREDERFVPHVTIVRDPKRAVPMAIAPLAWHVAGFELMASAEGAYEVLGRWPLRA
jgi:RNA 2',3'-cyclic 3'-phosphodiesterase